MLLFVGFAQNVGAQHTKVFDELEGGSLESIEYVVLTDIVVEGNRKTRRANVLREMSIGPGDTIWLNELENILSRERILLLNTSLFSEVEVFPSTLDLEQHRTIIRAVVREKWYFYPAVTFDLADRNFNIWWTEQGRALDRINFGLKFKHANTTGRADKLSVFGQLGYTRKGEIKYEIPYIDRKKILGLELGVLADQNREWGFRTLDGRLVFLDLDSLNVLSRRRFRVGLSVKPGLFLQHFLRIERHDNTIDTRLATAENPDFFGNARTRQRYWGFLYQMTIDRRDIRPFPIEGFLFVVNAEKKGLQAKDDINRLTASAQLSVFKGLGPRISIASSAKISTDLQRDPVPFFNRESLGYGSDFIRGYQLYVMDGLDYAYLKTTLRAEVFDREFNFPFAPVKRLERIPTRLYLGVHGDFGGIRDPFQTSGNVLANQTLVGFGVGAYVVFYYSKVIRFEVSRNEFGEWGGFLRYSLGF